MSNVTAQALATTYAELTASDNDQRWQQWAELYAAMSNRPKDITLKDITAASKATAYPMGQSVVQDCILAATFTASPLASEVLASRYADKKPVRVHTLIRKVINTGKGGTATVKDLADTLAAKCAKIDASKDDAATKAGKVSKAIDAAIGELLKAGKVEVKRAAQPEGKASKGDAPEGDAPETVKDAASTPLTGAEYLAVTSGPLGKFGEMAANGRLVAADREAWAAFRDRVAAIDGIVNSNRMGRSA
jgi:hypothetical protein